MLQSDKVGGVEDWYENQFHYVLGEIEDYDFFLATCLVVFKGPPGGGYKMVEDGVMNHTHFFMLPKEMRGRMLDNDFISGDSSPWQFLRGDDLTVIREEDRVVWRAAGRELIARPPYWEVRGSHKGIEMDLVMHSICPGFWYLGHFKDIAQNMSAGVDEYTQAEGTLTVGGKKYEISHAGGLYEHVALPGWDQVDIVSRGRYLWMVGWSEDIQIFVFYMPGLNNFTGHVIVDGKPISYRGAEQVVVDERGTWADPRSSMLTACQWHIRLISDEAVLDVIANNGGRTFTVNTFSNGHLGRYQNLAFASGNFTFADGKTIPIKDVRMGVDRTVAFNVLR
jgi:hypothetical protein